MTGSWTLVINAPGGQVFGANHDNRNHWRVTHQHRKAAKHAGATAAKAAGIPRLARIHVALTVHVLRPGATDPQNLPSGSTLKAILDSLADEKHICGKQCSRIPGGCPLKGRIIRRGIVPDDRPAHMDIQMPQLAPVGPKGSVPRVVVVITDISDESEAVA